MKNSLVTLGLAGLAVIWLTSAARAQELVQNGGFEIRHGGVLPGPDDWYIGGQTYGTPDAAHSGVYGMEYGTVGHDAPLSQMLNTTPGDTEVISFWQRQVYGAPDELSLDFGSARLLTLTNLTPGPWTEYTVTTTATSASTLLSFGLRQDPGYSYFDDVSVMQIASNPSGVPEPGALALLGSVGLTGVAFLRRKRVR